MQVQIIAMKELTIRESEILLLLKQLHDCSESSNSGAKFRKRDYDGARE